MVLDQIKEILKDTLLNKNFAIETERFLFEADELNNRKETKQYYYILKRK